MDFQLLKTLTGLPGVAGREDKARDCALAALKPLVDEARVDALGNIIALKKGSGKKLLFAAHLDEIGLAVNFIDSKGFLRFVPLGGVDPKTLVAQRVIVHAEAGPLYGVIGIKPPHITDAAEAAKAPKFGDLFIDIGMSKARAEKFVRLGDSVTAERSAVEFGDAMVTSKALDNRAGVCAVIEALRLAKNTKCAIYPVITAQEEVGARGAGAAAFGIEPDIVVAVDTTIAADVPGVPEHEQVTRVGGGAVITAMDSGTISDVKLVRFVENLAKAKKIPYQIKVINRGGTDASVMQRARCGAAACSISTPTRYIHSPVETFSKKDFDCVVRLVAALMENAHKF